MHPEEVYAYPYLECRHDDGLNDCESHLCYPGLVGEQGEAVS